MNIKEKLAFFVVAFFLSATIIYLVDLIQFRDRVIEGLAQDTANAQLELAMCGLQLNRSDRIIGAQNDTINYMAGLVNNLSGEANSLEWELNNSKLPFQRIAEGVANHTYDVNDYNCEDFTADLVKQLQGHGYDAYRIIRRVDCQSGIFDEEICEQFDGWHSFTKLDIYVESILGIVIPPEDYHYYGL